MANPETSDEDLKDSLRDLSEYSDDMLLDYADLLQKAGWESNGTFDKNLDKLIKYKEDINFKSLPKTEQNRILKEREETERQAKQAELDRIKAENEAKEKTEKLNLESKLANGLLQHAIQQNWTEQDTINKFLRGEQLTSSEEGIVNKVFEKYSGQTTDISQALNQELATLKNNEKNLWNQLNPNGSTQQTAQKPRQLQPVKLKNNNQAIAPQQTVQKNPQIQSIHNEINKLRQQKIKDEQEKEQLRQQLVEQQKTGSNANIQGKILQNGKRGFIGNEARLKAGDIDTKCNYAVVELSDLQTLTDEENPRQRNDRKAYANTVSERARNLDPDLLIDNSVGAQNGPIVVDQNLKVESGNGRTLSLREAYANRKGEGEYSNTETDAGYGKADIYRNKLIAEAPKYGISSEQVMQMKEPVLVRIRVADSNINAKDFWAKANNSQQESMSSTETALVDGEKIKPFLNQFEAIGDIRAKSNLKFVKSFLEKICSPYELNSMFTADGRSLSEAGEKRINNAIIASAYGNSEIVSLLTELGNEEIQTILNGLAMAAPDTAKLMGEVKSGAVHDVDFSKDLADAIRTIKNIRQNPDMNRLIKQLGSVSEVYLRQGLLGDDGLSPTARLFIGALGNLNNKETICNFLKSVNNTVRAEGNPNQLGMFEANTKPSDEVFVERAIRNMGLEYRNGKPIADDIERLKQGPVHVASNDDFHAEDAQGRRYSLGQTENTNTRTPEENYQLLMNQEPIDISINPLSNLVGKEQRTEAKNIYKRLLKIRVKTTDGKTVNFTNTGYKELKNHSANPLTLQIIPNLDELVRNAIYLYSEANHEQKRYNVDQYHYYTVKAQLINPETSKKEDYAVRIVLREDTNGNIFYDGDSTEITKIGKLREQSHRVPNTGNHVAPTNSLIKYFENVNFNKKKKLLDKAQSNHIGKTNTPSAISGGSFSNLSISDNDNLSSNRTEAERLADDGTTATREEFDSIIQNVNESLDPDAGISFEIYDSVEDFNKGRADKNKAPSDANAFIDKDTGKIVFFRDKLTTLTRLKQVIAHELVGHEGIERLLGGRYYNIFLKSIRNLASRDGRVGKLFAQVQRTYGRFYAPESHQMYEELGAHLAELYARKPERFSDRVHNYIRKLKVMLRNALRNWGVDIEFNQVDLEDILAKARDAVETNTANESTDDSGRRYSIGTDGQRMTSPEKDDLSDMWKQLNSEDSFEEDYEGEYFASLMDQIDQLRSSVQRPSSDARFSLASKLDPSKVTSDDVVDLLERIHTFDNDTYIPVRANTPNILIQKAKEKLGLNIPDLPIIMSVEKAKQAMEEKSSNDNKDKAHGITPYELSLIMEKLDKPDYIFIQKNGRFSELVKIRGGNGKKHLVVIDYENSKNSDLLNGYNGGYFNVVVTAFEPEEDYLKNYLKHRRIIFNKKERASQSDYGSRNMPSFLNDALPTDIVTENSDNGNQGEDTDINDIPAPRHYSLASDKELKRVSDHIGKYFNKNNMTSDEVETAILESVKNYGMNWIKIENYLKGKGLESGDFDDELANMVIEADEAIMENKKLNSKVYQSLKEYYEKNKLEKIANYIAQYNIDPERPGFIKLARDKVLDAINDGLNKYVYGGKYDYTNFLKYIKNRYDLRIPYKQLDKIAEAVYYNPIKKEDSGTIEDWLERNYDYDKNGELKTENGKVRYSLSGEKDPSKITSDDVIDLLERVKQTEFDEGTYIPVRANTPKIIIETAKNQLGMNIPNLPMIMQVKKAFDAMEEKTNKKASQAEKKHTHGISPYLMGEILEKLDKPNYIFYQRDNGYITEFVTVKDINGKKIHAIIDFYNVKPSNELNGYYGGVFNVVVTLFDRDKQSIEVYRKRPNNVMIYSSFGENSKGASSNHSGNLVPSYDYEAPSEESITENSDNRNPAEYTDRNDQKGNPYGSAKEGRGYSFSSGKPVIGYIVDMVGKKMNNKDRESLQNAIEADAYKYDTERTEPKTEGVVTANGFYYPYIKEGNYTFTVLGEYKKEPNARKKLEKGLLYYNGYRRWLDESGTEHDIPSRKDRHNGGTDSPTPDSFRNPGEYRNAERLDSRELRPQNEKIPWLGKDKENSGEAAGVRQEIPERDVRPEQSSERAGAFERKSNGEYEEEKRRFSLNSEENGRRYSLCEFTDSGERFVDVQANQEEFDGLSDKQKINKAIKIIKDKFAQKVIGIDNRVFVNSSQAKEYGYPPKEINDKDIINAKMRASTELDNLVDAGTNFRTEEDGKDGHIHPDAKNFEYFDVLFKVGDQFYKGVINIKNNNRGRLFYDITKIENVTKDQTDSTGNIPAFGFLRDISMPSEKSPDKFSIAENSDNRNPAEDTDSNDSNSKRVYSLGSTIEQQRKQFEDYVDGKMGIKLSDDEKDTIKAILETDDDADLDLNDIPTFGERLGNAKESLKTFLGQLITGLIGDTESRADRKKAPYLWQKDHSTENVVETPYEISRRTKIEQGMKTREEEDRLVLKHLDADKNLFTGLIRKWTKPGALQDWMLKKASRILAPFQIMKPVEQLLFTVAENIMWDEAKQQMVIAPYRDTEYDKQTNRPIGYKYDPNEKNGRLALDIYNNKLNDEFKAIIKERSIANNKYREDFVNRVVPFEQAKLYLARFGRKRLEGASKKIVDGNDRQAYSYITKLKGIIEDTEYNELISQYDQIKSIPDEQLGRNSAFINSIIGELAGNPAITTNGIDAKLNWLTTNKGLYGYAHHLVSIDPETGNGKPFNALGKISHPWIESIAGDRRGRKGDNSEYRSLLRADLERNRKEAEAEAANRWMEATENTYGITLEEAKNLEKLQKQGKDPGMPEGYEHRHKVIANFGKFRGKVIYLPDETFEAYQMIKDNRSLDSMKQFREFIQKMNNLNGRINEAMLWHPGKAMRDIMAGPFHLLEFLRDWSMKHPTEINDAAKAIWHGVKNSVSPEYWQSHSPESMGEYSESVIYQTQEGQSPTFGFIDSLFKYFQRAIPVGRTLEAMYKEINFAGGADIPLKRIFTTVGEELADKRGLTGQERERFIYDLVNDYAFDTGDLPEILGWLRGKKPDSKSQALGMISRVTVPFMGYATRMIKQMITDPVTKGAIPLAKRAFGNVDSDSNLRSEISEISRPFFWLMLKALIAAGLGGILPPPTAEEIQDMPGVPPSARTHGRFYVGDSDKGERWMSTKGLGQLETAYIMDDYLKGKSDIIDFSQEFITVHPVMKLIANAAGMTSEYDREVPFTAQVGRTLGSLLVPEMTRFGPDIEKLIRSVFKLGISNRKKQNFLNGFLSQFGIPTGQVLVDREGHLRLSDTAIELLKLQGINIREIPFDTIEETTRAEASRISNDAKRIKKLEDYRAGKYSPKTEQEFLKQDFGGDFSSVAEAENYYSNLAERERKVVDTATKLHNKGHWTDLEDVAREKKELAAEKKKQQNEGKPTKRRRPSRKRKVERPLLNDDLGYINNEIRKNISRQDEYQELYDKLMQNNKKHNPRRGVAGQLERLLKELK